MHNNGKFKHKHKFYHKFKKNKKNNNTGAMKDNTIDDYYKCLNIAKEESSIFEIDLNIFEKDKETIQNDLNIDYKVDLSKENENLITNKEDNQHPSLETNIKKTDGKQNILRKTNYLSFNTRLIINIILLIFVLILTLYFSISSFSIKTNQTIKYNEVGNIDYKVQLKQNDFYEQEYLDKNMLYISNLIKNINVNYKYNFKIDDKTDAIFTYKIIGVLSIMDNTAKNIFYQKEYELLDTKNIQMKNSNEQKIEEDIEIDYIFFNNIANEFKRKFGVNTSSNIAVKLVINQQSIDKNISFNENKTLTLTIPLSQRELRITTDSLNNQNEFIKNISIKINNYLYFALAIILLIIEIILIIILGKKIKLIIPKKSVYDKYIDSILNEYDRYIINTNTKPNLKEGDSVIKIEEFQELLDVRDNSKKPIKYYNIVNHQKCMFYIVVDNEIYEYVVKSIDLENKK